MVKRKAFITIEKGEPFERGKVILLTSRQMLVGRCWETIQPDISFFSPYISKRHALLDIQYDRFMITDLDSKHGTSVNGTDIASNQPYVLSNADKISLAKESAIFIFNNVRKGISGETIDFTDSLPCGAKEKIRDNMVVHCERREILIDGERLQLVGKDMELFLMLYQNRKKAVSYEEIKIAVWPERMTADKQPDVGNEEITVLVYRLRKRLGRYGRKIIAIPRYGYMLDLF
ncbi:MAG: FHA domain protein [Pelotomaculum sp. PtaU1.Bin035]|nr:MAG: FHA domain protein [Pelotomaculum sp. PtaU1.Bin035]